VALWTALATLTGLQKLAIHFDDSVEYEGDENDVMSARSEPELAFFFEQVSRLRRLRELRIHHATVTLTDEGVLHESLGALTQLTTLVISMAVSSACLRPILGLPCLQHLSVVIDDEWPPAALRLESHHLTRLDYMGYTNGSQEANSIGHILPASMPGLRTLRHLEVRCLGLLQFPLEIAGALWRLTKLDLASNRLRRIPPAITKITALHTLDLSLNRPLQLVPTDVDTLASMPGLSCLGVYKQERNDEEDAGFSQTRLKVLLALHARLPQLQLPGLEL